MININGVDIPNTVEELTIKQFDYLNFLEMDKSQTTMDRWINKFVYLGASEEAFDDMSVNEFKKCIEDFNEGFSMDIEKVTSVDIEGFTYEAKEELSAKDVSLIEKTMNSNRQHLAGEALAIIFKRTDLERKEHYANAHIKHKTALFNKQPCKLAIPYLNDILVTVTSNTEKVL